MASSARPLSVLQWIGVGVLLLVVVPPLLVFLLPGLAIAALVHRIRGRWLRLRWERTWAREGKRVLLVYSRSPNWQAYIETAWLPRLAPHAVVVDWSDRATWPRRPPLAIRAFRHWGGDVAFNQLAVLFPRRGPVRTIRFWQPFRDFRHGKEHALRKAEAELFGFVG